MAPSSETKRAGRLKLLWLIVLIPSSGVRNHPARTAPTIPTTISRIKPCCEFVPMIRLASQPIKAPAISQSDNIHLLFSFISSNRRLNSCSAALAGVVILLLEQADERVGFAARPFQVVGEYALTIIHSIIKGSKSHPPVRGYFATPVGGDKISDHSFHS